MNGSEVLWYLSDNPIASTYPRKITGVIKKREWIDSSTSFEIDGRGFNKWLRSTYNKSWESIKDDNLYSYLETYMLGSYYERKDRFKLDWEVDGVRTQWVRLSKVKSKK